VAWIMTGMLKTFIFAPLAQLQLFAQN